VNRIALLLLAFVVAVPGSANIIDGRDGRDSILDIGPSLGLSAAEISRIRRVSGYVGCLSPSPSVGTGTLFLADGQVLSVAHIFFERTGAQRSRCFFRSQDPKSEKIDIDLSGARFGSARPKAGSNADYAIVRLVAPAPEAEPFPVATEVPIKAGDKLIVVDARPVGLEHVDRMVPVAQGCTVRRVPISTEATNFYRTDCDATGSSSGGVHLARVNGELVLRGITITTGPWRDDKLNGAPYDERAGSVTTALATDAAILEAGRSLAGL
jgi:hypothetical protein